MILYCRHCGEGFHNVDELKNHFECCEIRERCLEESKKHRAEQLKPRGVV